MGAQVGSTCYADAATAAAAFCASNYPRTQSDGTATGTVALSCAVVDPSTLAITAASSAASATTSVPVSFGACDPFAPYADSLELWGLGILLCVLIWAARAAVRPVVGDF